MIVDFYCFCWNEADMLGFLFRHYDPIVRRYVVYDMGSTDGSREILQAHPRVEMRPRPALDPSLSTTVAGLQVAENCWRESSMDADWIIFGDVDEHLYHQDLPRYLKYCQDAGVTIVPALGYEMVSSSLPSSGERLSEVVTTGTPWTPNNKLNVFAPRAIERLNYGPGRHRAWPTGHVRAPDRDELMLLHYKYLDFERVLKRHEQRRPRLNLEDADRGFAHRWRFSRAELLNDWIGFEQNVIDVSRQDLRPGSTHSAERWWEPYRLSQMKADTASAAASTIGTAQTPSKSARGLLQAAFLGLMDGDMAVVVDRAAELRSSFPDDFFGYQIGAEGAHRLGRLEQADTICAGAIERFPSLDWPLVYGLSISKQLGKLEDAAQRAAELRRRAPGLNTGYQTGATVARELRRWKEASCLSEEGAKRFPMYPWPLIEKAHIANALRKPEEAIVLTNELRRLFPKHPAGYQIGASTARRLGRWHEASLLCAETIARFPTYAWPMAERTHIANGLGKLKEAAGYAAELRSSFPEHSVGFEIGASVARRLGHWDDANALCTEGLSRFPAKEWPLVERVQIAVSLGKLDEVTLYASELRRRFPKNPSGYQFGASTARKLGRLDEADALGTIALQLFPNKEWPIIEKAHVATALGRPDAAVGFAAELRRRFPQSPSGYRIGSRAARQSGRFEQAIRLCTEAEGRFSRQKWLEVEKAQIAKSQKNVMR